MTVGKNTSVWRAVNGYVRAATLSPGGEMTVGDFNGDGFDDLAATTIDGVDVYLSTP